MVLYQVFDFKSLSKSVLLSASVNNRAGIFIYLYLDIFADPVTEFPHILRDDISKIELQFQLIRKRK